MPTVLDFDAIARPLPEAVVRQTQRDLQGIEQVEGPFTTTRKCGSGMVGSMQTSTVLSTGRKVARPGSKADFDLGRGSLKSTTSSDL